MPNDPQWTNVAVVGAGTIGLSWAALFAAHGRDVQITDPCEDLEQLVADAIPSLSAGIPDSDPEDLRSRVRPVHDLAEAVADADLVQENGPERLESKQDLFAEIARLAPDEAVLASSSSGIVASEIAAKLSEQDASRVLIAHPFNPPHVVPLVEIVPGERTAEPVITRAIEFYRTLGKTPVREHKEVSGFVANRLQSALMQEAISLVLDGVVSADELDTVMKSSLGGRYATVGPFESFHLGGGPGGIRHMMQHLGHGMARRWGDLGHPALTSGAIEEIAGQTESAYGSGPEAYRARSQRRDRKHLALRAALHDESAR